MKIRILNILQKHGFTGSIKIVGFHIASYINQKLYYHYCHSKPIDYHLIVMESEGDLTDNAYALYDFMVKNGYLKIYHIVWLVDDLNGARKEQQEKPELFPNTEFICKFPNIISNNWSKVLATCKLYIYDHCNILENFNKRSDTFVVNLWHGCGFKRGKGKNIDKKSSADINFMIGQAFCDVLIDAFDCTKDKLLDIGYPRNDYLFYNNSFINNKISAAFNLKKYKKIAIWMPTFRRSINDNLDEKYFNSRTGLPIIEDEKSLIMFNDLFQKYNSLCIIKIHHLQSRLSSFSKKYSKILFASILK